MKTVRKRAIKRVMKPHVINLLDQYNGYEQFVAAAGASHLSFKEMHSMLNTLEHYGHLSLRLFWDHNYHHQPNWLKEIGDYA